jgi:hypothetical protein
MHPLNNDGSRPTMRSSLRNRSRRHHDIHCIQHYFHYFHYFHASRHIHNHALRSRSRSRCRRRCPSLPA